MDPYHSWLYEIVDIYNEPNDPDKRGKLVENNPTVSMFIRISVSINGCPSLR